MIMKRPYLLGSLLIARAISARDLPDGRSNLTDRIALSVILDHIYGYAKKWRYRIKKGCQHVLRHEAVSIGQSIRSISHGP